MKLSEISKQEFIGKLTRPVYTEIQKRLDAFVQRAWEMGWDVYTDDEESSIEIFMSRRPNKTTSSKVVMAEFLDIIGLEKPYFIKNNMAISLNQEAKEYEISLTLHYTEKN